MRENYKNKYSIEDVIEAVKTSKSIRQVLDKLGVIAAGGNYSTINRFIKKHQIDISHFTGQGWRREKTFNPVKPITDYLVKGNLIQSHRLRLRLLKEGIFEYKCYSCGLAEWLGKPIPLELEHIDGVRDNNTLSNLTLLCPNCHAQTDTYRGKNIGKNK